MPRLRGFRPECDIPKIFGTNKYPNILTSKNLHERMSEYIRISTNLKQTNIWMNFCFENVTNIQIYLNIQVVFTF